MIDCYPDFIQDNPAFNYEKLIAGTHDDIDMSAFYNNHDEMANTFGYRDDFERNVQDCTYDFYLHLLGCGRGNLNWLWSSFMKNKI